MRIRGPTLGGDIDYNESDDSGGEVSEDSTDSVYSTTPEYREDETPGVDPDNADDDGGGLEGAAGGDNDPVYDTTDPDSNRSSNTDDESDTNSRPTTNPNAGPDADSNNTPNTGDSSSAQGDSQEDSYTGPGEVNYDDPTDDLDFGTDSPFGSTPEDRPGEDTGPDTGEGGDVAEDSTDSVTSTTPEERDDENPGVERDADLEDTDNVYEPTPEERPNEDPQDNGLQSDEVYLPGTNITLERWQEMSNVNGNSPGGNGAGTDWGGEDNDPPYDVDGGGDGETPLPTEPVDEQDGARNGPIFDPEEAGTKSPEIPDVNVDVPEMPDAPELPNVNFDVPWKAVGAVVLVVGGVYVLGGSGTAAGAAGAAKTAKDAAT